MDARQIIGAALARGRTALNEYDSKRVLGLYGLPVAAEALAATADQAVERALDLGWPVALKACSDQLMHKSDGGWLALGLGDRQELRRAAQDMLDKAAAQGQALDGLLVQAMAPGGREAVMGLSRDPQFGPCVMLGLGGVFTEIIGDAVFRMAPFDEIEAADMVSQLKGAKMLGAFRGQRPVDMDALCRALVGLGRLGAEMPEVSEVDVNPVIIGSQGGLTAVDGLIVLQGSVENDLVA